MDDLRFASAAQVADSIRAGEVSATEVLEALLAQSATRNPGLNAIVTLDAEGARARARAADEARALSAVTGPFQRPPGY